MKLGAVCLGDVISPSSRSCSAATVLSTFAFHRSYHPESACADEGSNRGAMLRMSPIVARNGPQAMSAIWSLTGGKRTSRRQPNSVAIDPCCVKTCAHEKRAELVSLLSCPGNRRQRFCFFNRLKSRRNFRSQIRFRRFHAAKTRSGHRAQTNGVCLRPSASS